MATIWINGRMNITGERAGSLVAVEPTGDSDADGRVWLCRCDCGGSALRSVAQFNLAKAAGRQSCCRSCHKLYRRSAAAWQRAKTRAHFRDEWAAHHSLWTSSDDIALAADTLADLEGEFGPTRDGWDPLLGAVDIIVPYLGSAEPKRAA